jgi:hypothetical protein
MKAALLDNFIDQPVDAAAHNSAHALMNEWSTIIDQTRLDEIFDAFNHTALQLQASHDPPTVESTVCVCPPSAIPWAG